MQTIQISNPMPGGSWYTSTRKAHEFVKRGRAVIEDGMLRFIDRPHAPARLSLDNPSFWNGAPKPKVQRKVSIRRIYDPDCGPIIPMHRPGEVRS